MDTYRKAIDEAFARSREQAKRDEERRNEAEAERRWRVPTDDGTEAA